MTTDKTTMPSAFKAMQDAGVNLCAEAAMLYFKAAMQAALGYSCDINPSEELSIKSGQFHVSLYRCEGYVREAYGCVQVDLHTYTEGRFIVEFEDAGSKVFKLTHKLTIDQSAPECAQA